MNVFWLQRTEADVPIENGWLCGNEMLLLSHMRFAKRRADWRLGRWTAKCAVAAFLGRSIETTFLTDIEIRQALSGAPEVFLTGLPATIAISLSHRAGTAMAAVGPSGIALGCDLEIIEPRSDLFIADYFTHKEQVLVARAPALDRPALVALLWSAKESALKALHQGLRVDTRSVLVNKINVDGISGHNVQTSQEHAVQWAQEADRNCSQDQWHTLELLYATDGRTFHGWWQRGGNIVRTVVADRPLFPPSLLDSELTADSQKILSHEEDSGTPASGWGSRVVSADDGCGRCARVPVYYYHGRILAT